MSDKKVIAVTGATGAQGGAVVNALLETGGFTVRAITRNADSDKGKSLKAKGCEVVSADFDDPSTLLKAFEGCYGVFLVTNWWEHFDNQREWKQGTAAVDAAKQAGVKHLVWSTLEDTRKVLPADGKTMPVLHGAYNVAHFDTKGEIDEYIKKQGVPATNLLTSFYFDNFISMMKPAPNPDGKLGITFCMGDKKLPGVAVQDIGRAAAACFADPSTIGKTVGVAGDHLTGDEYAAVFTKVTGKPHVYNNVPPEVYRGFGFPGCDDLANMFQFKRDFDGLFRGARSLETSKKMNPKLLSFEAWLEQNKAAFA